MEDTQDKPKVKAAKPKAITFTFMAQAPIVDTLLSAASMALKVIPAGSQRNNLVSALRPFENFSVLTLWGKGDLLEELTEGEKAEVLRIMVERFSCTDHEWSYVESCENAVLKLREEDENV